MERWKAEWQTIDSRVEGLLAITRLVQETYGMKEDLNHDYLCQQALKPYVVELVKELRAFRETHKHILPDRVLQQLNNGIERADRVGGNIPTWQSALNTSILIAGTRAEISAGLADAESDGRRHTERAFEHLQRSIVVDEDYRRRWRIAYENGETACERLGAVHLLLHGIWAFKAYSAGEQTDLVAQESRAITRTDERMDLVTRGRLTIDRKVESADVLVLTEWKLARTRDEIDGKIEEGRKQAAIYSGSSLAASELASVRYVVIVTQRREEMPEDAESERPTIYRFINVAVTPDHPSNEARR